MIKPSIPQDEASRLEALRATELLDTPIEERFERVTGLAQLLLDVPIAAVSLVDAERQWFKSIQGLDVAQTSREVSFCGHTIVDRSPLVVNDARVHETFRDNPLVTDDPGIVFYAGHPVFAEDGSCLGSLCVIDRRQRTLNPGQLGVLRDLAGLIEVELRHPPQQSVQRMFLNQLGENCSSMVDPLTRLWNRDGTRAVLSFMLDQARASAKAVGVVRVRVDGLSSVDMHGGPEAVDGALREVARRLVGTIWPADAVGRLDDDVFLMIVGSGDAKSQRLSFAEQAKHKIADIGLAGDNRKAGLRAEIGTVAFMPNEHTTVADVLRAAEHAATTHHHRVH